MHRIVSAVSAALLAAPLLVASDVRADAQHCVVVDTEFTPAPELQIVVWLEDTSGHYIDTLYITQQTGSFGGEFRARWQHVLTLQFVRFNFLSDMYHA